MAPGRKPSKLTISTRSASGRGVDVTVAIGGTAVKVAVALGGTWVLVAVGTDSNPPLGTQATRMTRNTKIKTSLDFFIRGLHPKSQRDGMIVDKDTSSKPRRGGMD